MIFSKQLKSLDRRFFFFRKHIPLLNRLYNTLSKINIENSIHFTKAKNELLKKSRDSIEKILAPTRYNGTSNDIPRTIWIYWNSGFENAPDVVKLGVESWQKMNPDYDVKLLSDENLYEFLGFDFSMVFQLSSVRCLLPTKADILRFYLLSRYGGVWVDATTFCLKPLNLWLPLAASHCHLFNFKQKNNPTRPIEAWFIASPQGSEVINDVLQQYIDFITKPRKISLYISGKVSLLEKLLSKQELTVPLDPSVSYRAEKIGFMPYFSVAYFFYESLKNKLSKQQLDIYLRQDNSKMLTNNYALTKDPFSEYKNAFVSKQTYINSYIASDLYKKRKELLEERLRLIL
jgi:Mannosyltransferase OCH1 and related enzymes